MEVAVVSEYENSSPNKIINPDPKGRGSAEGAKIRGADWWYAEIDEES